MLRICFAICFLSSVVASHEELSIESDSLSEDRDENPNLLFIRNYMLQHDDVVVLPSGLRYRVIRTADKDHNKPAADSHCTIKYKQKNIYGDVVDTSESSSSKSVHITPNKVMPGLSEVLQLMEPGDVWEVVIPAPLSHGKFVRGKRMPRGTTLIFEIELLKHETGKPEYFKREYLMWAFLAIYFVYNYYESTQRTKAVIRKTPISLESVKGLSGNPEVGPPPSPPA